MTMTVLPTEGESNAANMLRRAQADVRKHRRETVTFSNYLLEDQLFEVFKQCSEPGWEGEGTEVVVGGTLDIAKELVESLPKAYQTPSISGEPDGHVNLEWYVNPRRILTVSVNQNRTLHWAALIGSEDPRGSCRFYGDTPPETLLYWIGRICKDV